MTSAWSITASANPPRAAYTDFPLGHTAGRPHCPDEQVEIIRDALTLFETLEHPGTIIPLAYTWPSDEWRAEARVLEDTRTARHETPQYQSEQDREAAIANHGEEFACSVCVPADVPRT